MAVDPQDEKLERASTVAASPQTESMAPREQTSAVQRHRAEGLVGTRLAGRFDLVSLLGSGAFGDVYEARDARRSGPNVALKLLRHASAEGVYRLKQEFRSLADAAHPNLVSLYELFLEEEHAFFTMQLVRGSDFLGHVRPAGVLDEARVRRALSELSRGVSALHALGRVHRDLKPSNVLIEHSGRLVIVDLGVAAALDAEPGRTELGFVGTPAYAAPEQLSGREVGTPCDWYAVGVVLYEALTGRLPFDGPYMTLVEAKNRGMPTPKTTLPESLSDLVELCARLLAPKPDARPDGATIIARLGEPPAESMRAPTPRDAAFVGRERELAALETALGEVERGASRTVLVTGSSGLGKTALVERFLGAVRARGKSAVLRGRCYVSEEIPYRAFDGVVDALSHYLRSLSLAEAAAVLPRDVRALAQLFPVLLRVEAVQTAPLPREAPPGEQVLRARAFTALRELLSAIGDRTELVLFIDDVQWDDVDSAWLLPQLLAGARPPSLLLVLACRAEERTRSHVVRALTGDASLAGCLREVALAPLSEQETEQLTRAALGSDDASDEQLARIAVESRGHPLFALELLRAASREDGSGTALGLDEAIRLRASTLGEPAQRLLATICVAGHRLRRETALHVAGSDSEALRELIAERLCTTRRTDGDDSVEPYHDRVREAVAGGLEGDVRKALHGALADALLGAAEQPVDLVVEHLLAAGRRKDAARHAAGAAEHAARALAFHRVPALLSLALEHAAPELAGELWVKLGAAHGLLGHARDAAQAFLAAAELSGDADARWELTRRAMWQALQGGQQELGLSLLDKLERQLGLSSRRRVLSFQLRTVPEYLRERLFGPPRLSATRAEASAETAVLQKRLLLSFSVFTGVAQTNAWMSGYYAQRALRLAARLGERDLYATMLASIRGGEATLSGVPSEQHERGLDEALALCEGREDPGLRRLTEFLIVAYYVCTAQVRRAHERLSALLEAPIAATETGAYALMLTRMTTPAIMFWRGAVGSLPAALESWIQEGRELSHGHLEAGLRAVSAYRHLVRDDPERALADWRAADALSSTHVAFWDPIWGLIVGLYAGKLDFAAQVIARSRHGFWHWAVYMASSRVLHHWARGCLAAARLHAGNRSLRNRLSLRIAEIALRCERAALRAPFIHHLAAVRAFAAGRESEGVRELERALAIFEERGMRLFAASARFVLAQRTSDGQRAEHAAAARQIFDGEGIERPELWARALLPGLC